MGPILAIPERALTYLEMSADSAAHAKKKRPRHLRSVTTKWQHDAGVFRMAARRLILKANPGPLPWPKT